MLEHERWLAVAKRDLDDARLLCKGESFPSATYHAQQAAEKALKAYLVFNNQEIVKIHDLIKLNDMCQKIDKDFQRLDIALKMLNPFATKFRYPSVFDLPDLNDAKITIKQAESVINFVRKKIYGPIVSQMNTL